MKHNFHHPDTAVKPHTGFNTLCHQLLYLVFTDWNTKPLLCWHRSQPVTGSNTCHSLLHRSPHTVQQTAAIALTKKSSLLQALIRATHCCVGLPLLGNNCHHTDTKVCLSVSQALVQTMRPVKVSHRSPLPAVILVSEPWKELFQFRHHCGKGVRAPHRNGRIKIKVCHFHVAFAAQAHNVGPPHAGYGYPQNDEHNREHQGRNVHGIWNKSPKCTSCQFTILTSGSPPPPTQKTQGLECLRYLKSPRHIHHVKWHNNLVLILTA